MKALKNTVLTLTFLVISASAIAQGIEPTITYTKKVALSADEVWEQIRILDNIDKISSFVSKVQFTGPKNAAGGSRVCTNQEGNGYFKENIIEFSDSERAYTYAVVEGVPAKNMKNNFKIVDLGYNSSMIIWTSNFEFMENPNMTKDQFHGFLKTAISEMIENSVKNAQKP